MRNRRSHAKFMAVILLFHRFDYFLYHYINGLLAFTSDLFAKFEHFFFKSFLNVCARTTPPNCNADANANGSKEHVDDMCRLNISRSRVNEVLFPYASSI